MEDLTRNTQMESRRDVLKKAGKSALFVIPTIMTFKASELHAKASGLPREPKNPFRGGK